MRCLALLAGIAAGSCIGGAVRELVAMPPLVVAAFGAIGALLALAQSRRLASAFLLACGTALGLMLPRSIPATGAVVTNVATAERGDLFELLDEIDADPSAVLGRRATVAGEWSPAIGERAATISRRVMTCCAADAIRAGFDVYPSRAVRFADGTVVRVTGILIARWRDGELRYALTSASVEAAGAIRRP